jgi:electron transfer flavoprotein beta subunit
LAEYLGIPYVGYVAGVQVNDCAALIRKEFPSGLVAELETFLPAVLGIQASEQPPRYVAFSKIRQVMKTVALEEKIVTGSYPFDGPVIERMYQPEIGMRAEMIPGDANEVANRLINIFMELNLL